MQTIDTNVLLSVCLSVCVLVTSISHTEMAESVEMPFGGQTHKGFIIRWRCIWAPTGGYN